MIGAASEHTIHIWDIVDLKQPRLLDSLDGHSHSVRALIMLTNTSMVSVSWGDTMRIWDLSDIHTIRCLKAVENCSCKCIKLSVSLLLTADQFFNTSLLDITYPNNPRYLCKINKDHDAKAVVPCDKRNSFLLGNILYEPDNNALSCCYTLPFNNQVRLEALVKQLRRLKKELAREWDKKDRRLYLNTYGFQWFKAMPESIQECLKTHFAIADKPASQLFVRYMLNFTSNRENSLRSI